MSNQINNQPEDNAQGGASAAEQSKTENTAEQAATTPKQALTEEQQNAGDIDFGAILEQFEQEQTVFHAGELVEGRVVGVSDRGVLVDFGYKSEGIVPVEEFTGPEGEPAVTVGDTVEVVIRSIHSGDAPPQLSRSDALNRKVWSHIEDAYKEGKTVTGRIIDKTKGGLRVDLDGIEAFLPGSQIDSRPIRSLDSYKGQEIEAKIIKFSRRRNNIVLSRKVLTDEIVNQQKSETLSKIDVGYVVEGTIKNLTEYGAFVDIGGIDGLLHVTDMSWGRIHHPSDQFHVGEHIQVKVLKLDREKEKVSLGYKQLLPDPWSTVVEVYPVDSKVKGKVSSVTEYGVFVELEPGVEGLVHVSEISWSKRSQSPKRLFHKGDEVEVQVLGVDTVEKRISLGMKQFQENPWDHVEERYPVGSKIHGRVRNLTDFGAFVELEEGIDGLVHVSDITWAKKVKHPKELLKKDQEVDAIVTHIDKAGQRLSLSMKDLMPSAWEGFVATHRPGDVVRGKVSRFTNFGIFVELGEGLEGLCHISELSDERVERADQVAELGQEMDFKILRIEHEDQKIGLSHRAVGKEDEPVVDTKMYSTEAKGGMASLGELANLKFGRAAETPAAEKKEEPAADESETEQPAAAEPAAAETATEPEAAPEPAESEPKAEDADAAAVEPAAETAAEAEAAVGAAGASEMSDGPAEPPKEESEEQSA
jgi:small subunit ribosomal protein S1